MEIRLIVNPHAGAGSAAAKTEQLRSLLGAAGVRCEIVETKRPGHATEIAAKAATAGISLLVVVGGDGTLNEVVQAYIDADGKPAPGPDLALVPAGTGGDFCRSFNLDGNPRTAVERLLSAKAQPVDLGVARVHGPSGAPETRAFINIASVGISATVARMTNQGGKWMGGKLAFYSGTMRATLGYRNAPVRVFVDGQQWHQGPVYTVVFANARFFGGGMQVAPEANPSDGLLDCVLLGDFSRLEAIANTPLVYKGKHLELKKTRTIRGRHFRVEPWLTDDAIYVETDGETPGSIPLEVEVLPGAISLRA